MRDLVAALGLVLVIEGLSLAAFPAAWRRAMKAILKAPEQPMRIAGLVAGVVGVVLVWLVRAHF
ncbi:MULTISPECIES: DUF2065 domain-containing protein [Azorhizobium]|uniref:DUF2065 domain-containing protein n=1 Tax=Azorhizobium caulinodans (strain ATCC 43989 / DSM 5975 / JCM 20966 / LMG 6465 / NBRC 14845 / NCIMB 13405 / ORS 571) TaxID=438753 RepID=A8IAW3_AZOC5|nr:MULTISPECIES: DUF2065 domain-containing protein [Azorhizobium]TDT99734.1 hypothetical protein DFO45_1445 [Azorhizobium sp. AG788]BAF88569.1 uncharacterized protein AZC_2571 [Azorhizobium caulinodans ORS 571]